MATHADAVREAERQVVADALAFEERGTSATERRLLQSCATLRRERAATCPTCGGMGSIHHEYPDGWSNDPCPIGCDAGKRRNG